MFILHSSNKTENLLWHLTTVIETAPLSSPFAQEVFLIQSQGMERWLSQQLASHFKVWGNYQFLFPSKFFSALAQQIDSRLNDADFARERMLWRIEMHLRDLDGPVFLPLKHYLDGPNSNLKRYQLARQLAQAFDQYQLLRPDMLALWQQGETLYHTATERWQLALWQKLSAQLGEQHRGALWLDTIAKFNLAPVGTYASVLPERIFIFGVNTLPPLFLSFLDGLSKHCQLHLFLLNPAQDYWADLASKRQRTLTEDASGHPLLAALGQQGREFQTLLLEQMQFDFEPESFEPSAAHNNLQHLQNDILANQLPTNGIALSLDDSISIHACHSRMREVEVLKNLLLARLESSPSLALRDIVVMAPDIQVYEPFIAAVFSDIQHAIADRSLRLDNHALDAFIRFLSLSQGRFGWHEILDLLEQPVVYPHFGLSETDLETIRVWLQATHVRWGKSAAHKHELGLPALAENTWLAALERLLMGYAVGNEEHFVGQILPFADIEGTSALALGGLCDYLQLLFAASTDLKQPKTLKAWSAQLLFYADQLLAADPLERQQLNELLVELAADFGVLHTAPLELPVLVCWLEDRVAEHKSANGFLRGQLTFCSMLPMRSIPFQVIALLGMNEGEFPKLERNPSFDLLTHHFRKGDRSRRADDRYQFLEILLSAREQLIITYIGQSISDNQAIAPAVVISELLEVLQDSYQLTGLITRHPLQAFSPRYFDTRTSAQGNRLFSFSAHDCATAQALSTPKPPSTPWWQGVLPAHTEAVIAVDELFSFFRHPQRHFLRRQLDIRFLGISADAEEREPFTIEKMDSYLIHHEWLEQLLTGQSGSVKKLQAQGRWLSGVLGELEYAKQYAAISAFAERIQDDNLGAPLDDMPIDIDIDGFRVVGLLRNRYQNGSLFYRYADLKGKDFVCAWLHHLLANQVEPQSTYLHSKDEAIVLLPEHCQAGELAAWLAIYQQGNTRPDAFFTEAALAYIRQAAKLAYGSRAQKPPLVVAQEHLALAIQQAYEPELQQLYATTATDALLGDVFVQQCGQMLLPIWLATHEPP
ncbi:MAG: exodeoxyribonuclease V subunit gamma [Methylococcaceae bacterium]|nr:exodeoxyribonuclease V subunit gamma [Methylococcaceae bacterium]